MYSLLDSYRGRRRTEGRQGRGKRVAIRILHVFFSFFTLPSPPPLLSLSSHRNQKNNDRMKNSHSPNEQYHALPLPRVLTQALN